MPSILIDFPHSMNITVWRNDFSRCRYYSERFILLLSFSTWTCNTFHYNLHCWCCRFHDSSRCRLYSYFLFNYVHKFIIYIHIFRHQLHRRSVGRLVVLCVFILFLKISEMRNHLECGHAISIFTRAFSFPFLSYPRAEKCERNKIVFVACLKLK